MTLLALSFDTSISSKVPRYFLKLTYRLIFTELLKKFMAVKKES